MSIGIPKPGDTYLAEDTQVRLNQQRVLEQEGLRRLSGKRVIASEREVEEKPKADVGLEEEHGQDLQEHPLLGQDKDGIDTRLWTDARAKMEHENARNEQELQHRLKLGLQPGKTFDPQPGGP